MASDLLELFRPYTPKFLREMDSNHFFRLLIIVFGYYIIRNTASKYLATRQLQQQLDKDASDRDLNKIRELVDDPKDNADASGFDDGTFGFGKRTRRTVKRKEQRLKEELEKLPNADEVDSDADIAELLDDDWVQNAN